MGDLEHAATAYENALRHNPMSIPGLTQVAGIARIKENYPMAVEYFQRVLALQQDNGEIWSALGHCYLMQDDLQKAYSAYQHALYSLPNPKENPKLWYGIGILYDRYGSLDNAEEAFSSVLKMDKDFDKSNEVLFRLGIIYKQQTKYDESLRCFDRILRNPPSPLANADIWFQIGHVYEQQGDHVRAREAYERVVAENPVHAKVLQQLGWLYHQDGPSFQNQDLAIQYLTKSLEADPSDAQSWYLLGRAYMAGQKYNKAYEAYQQAVYRDGRNPTFWCSIGVLYFQINQYRDALDAYSRAIRINPYIPEVWFDLGSLYESCNNQIGDAIDAYARAAELDPGNAAITQRLHLLKHSQATGCSSYRLRDCSPSSGLGGLPLLHVNNSGRPIYRADSRGPGNDIVHHPPHIAAAETSPAPFRGGPPPPVVIDESRHAPSHAQLAPMDVDHIPHGRDAPYLHPPSTRDSRQLSLTTDPHPRESDGMRGTAPHDSYYSRSSRAGSIPPSPPVHTSRPRSPTSYHGYPPSRVPVSTAPTSIHRSPHAYPRESSGNGPVSDREAGWDRRDWERGRDSSRRRGGPAYLHGPSSPPRAQTPRARSPSQASPMSAHPSRGYWDSRPAQPPQLQPRSPRAPPPDLGVIRSTSGDRSEYWQSRVSIESPPESARNARVAPPTFTGSVRGSESPRLTTQRPVDPATEYKRRRGTREKEMEVSASPGEEAPKRDRKRRTNVKQKGERGRTETPKPYGPLNQNPPFKVTYPKRDESAGPSSSAGSGSQSRSAQPSPTSTVPVAPARVVDEDYDEGVADALMGLASYRAPEQTSTFLNGPSTSAGRPISPSPSMRSHSHRGSVSSTRSRASPPPNSGSTSMKRPLSPGPDDVDSKRTKVDIPTRKASSPGPSSSRPSPIPLRNQPSHSPENRQAEKSKHSSYPSSPQLPSVLPLPPRPIGAGLSSHTSNSVALPPIATLSPASTAPSPAHEQERMSIDRTQSRSVSPQAQTVPRGKFVEVMNPTEPLGNSEPSS
ncbi:hypothetical protein B0F90DRAFT_1807017 [Multifurca ochricompacta]|uniref:TPR-like protein n=1 Tax=Multifurca ochricompacta TaxID=376703 RepID=A0AAD4MBW1_9AGAM|nr:hypothetical protein B0F90DRAFT_1807017 [Multifurca ochricompacta]